MTLVDAREKVETWRDDYNTFLPHSSLGNLTSVACSHYHQQMLSEHDPAGLL